MLVFVLDRIRIDVELRILERDGEQVSLESKVFDLILYLVRSRGRVVGHDELMLAVWPDVPATHSRPTTLDPSCTTDQRRRA